MSRILKLRGADGKWLEVPAIKGSEGATFTPHLSETGDLSWTNNKGLPNPDPVNIMGKVSTDTTLTVKGTPADAKATGDKIIDVELGSTLRVKNLRTEFNKSLSDLDEAKQPKGNYLTSESDPTVPSWAKEETKPKYTANEVGALPKDGTAVDSSKLGGKAPEYYIQPHNLLDNSDFRNPVNQRGAITYEGAGYGIDRWKCRVVLQTMEVRSSDITITATGGSYAGILQKVENMSKLAGKTVTFAAKIYSNVAPELVFFDASGQALALKIGITGATQTIILTYDVPSDATADSVVPTILLRTSASGDYMRIYWAALYEGAYTADTLPAYQPKGYAAELKECMRYYQVFGKKRLIQSTEPNGGFTISERFPIAMRVAPTIMGTYVAWATLASGPAAVVEKTDRLATNESRADGFIGYYAVGIAKEIMILDYAFTASADL